MSLLKPRRKTTRSPRAVSRGGDLQKLHIKVNSPRIVMYQVLRGLGKSVKIILLLAMLAMIAWGGYLGVRHIFIDNEEYRLQEIVLDPADGYIDHARVVAVGEIDLEASIFEIDIERVKKRLSDLPEVTHCRVERRLPGTLIIEVTERKPVAWIHSEAFGFPGKSKNGVLADRDGVSFPCEGALWEMSRNLPVIEVREAQTDAFDHGSRMKHAEVMRAIRLLEAMRESDIREEWMPRRFVLLNKYSMLAVGHDGSKVVFGLYNHERQIADFITIREHALATKRVVEHINLIPEKNIPVRFRGGPVLVKPKKNLPTSTQQ